MCGLKLEGDGAFFGLEGGNRGVPLYGCGPRRLKARFHEPTNHDDERDKTADE